MDGEKDDRDFDLKEDRADSFQKYSTLTIGCWLYFIVIVILDEDFDLPF